MRRLTVMSMMRSEIFAYWNPQKHEKSRYLEKETLLFLQIKKFLNYTSRAILLQQKIVL